MARYIDADALERKVNDLSTHPLNEWDTMGVLAIIDEQPTADVVEVVRCKDCKYGLPLTDANGITVLSCNYKNAHGMLVENHGFCKWGERREDDQPG